MKRNAQETAFLTELLTLLDKHRVSFQSRESYGDDEIFLGTEISLQGENIFITIDDVMEEEEMKRWKQQR